MLINSYMFGGGGGDTDPYFSNVVLLMHFDGADNSTTFTDSSSYARTISTFGNAKLVTSQKAFGTASGYFDGSGDALQAPSSTDWNFGTGDFTIEMMLRYNALPPAAATFVGNWPGSNTWLVEWRSDTGSKYTLYDGAFRDSAVTTPATNTWYHLAITRSGTSLRFFIDGVQRGSTLTNSTNFSGTAILTIALANGTGWEFNGWMDELRITKGVARYTAAFTPPTAAFPDS